MDSRVCPVEEEPAPTILELGFCTWIHGFCFFSGFAFFIEHWISKMEEQKFPPPIILVLYFYFYYFVCLAMLSFALGFASLIRSCISKITCFALGFAFLMKSCISEIKKLHKEEKNNITAAEKILSYKFKDKELLQDALTHSYKNNNKGKSFTSYRRLAFLGDTVIGLAVSKHLYSTYPSLDPEQLSSLRAANTSIEKLALVAVRHGLHRVTSLVDKVQEFADVVSQEEDIVIHGSIEAQKILANIVKSLAAATYLDLNFDLQKFWVIFRGLLEPIVTPEVLQQQPHPITSLCQQCQKQEPWREREKNIASIYVNGVFVASSTSNQIMDIAKLQATKQALLKLSKSMPTNIRRSDFSFGLNKSFEIELAKQKLHEVCQKKRWARPNYSIEEEEGPSHNKKYVCSVQMKDPCLYIEGEEKSRVKEAENSAASCLIFALLGFNMI